MPLYPYIYNDEDEPDEEKTEQKSPNILRIIEEKMLEKRHVFLWGVVDDDSAKEVISKLLYLDTAGPGKKITFFINSPGGMVTSGMAILDTMDLIASPVATVCMGLAASMGSILLSAGTKGERYIYPHGEVMIHQPSIGRLIGDATNIEISAKQIVKTREIGAKILAKNCGQTVDKVLKDFDRDYWMDSNESIKYGIVDKLYKFEK